MTNCWLASISPFQSSSTIGPPSTLLDARDQDVGHERHGRAKGDQHRHAGEVHGVARVRVDRGHDGRERVVHEGDHDEHDADERCATGGHRAGLPFLRRYSRYRIENRRIQTTSTKCQYRDVASTMSWWRELNWPAMPRYRTTPSIRTP